MSNDKEKTAVVKNQPNAWLITFGVTGRYGYHVVAEYRAEDGAGYCEHNPLVGYNKRQATEIADALNSAYQRGHRDGYHVAEQAAATVSEPEPEPSKVDTYTRTDWMSDFLAAANADD